MLTGSIKDNFTISNDLMKWIGHGKVSKANILSVRPSPAKKVELCVMYNLCREKLSYGIGGTTVAENTQCNLPPIA